MDIASEIKDFLTERRGRITPDQVGLPSGGRRRVPGLRREEVAMLAGVSAEYYVQIERGNVSGVSEEVMYAVASTLRLDEDETDHLLNLVRSSGRKPRRRARAAVKTFVNEPLQTLIDSMVGAPAVVMTGWLDIVATNPLGAALYSQVIERAEKTPNMARFLYLDQRADESFPDWNTAADDAVAMLRTQAGRTPQSKPLTELVGELATRSEEFRVRWARQEIAVHRRGVKRFVHADVGDIALRFESLDIASADGLTLYAYTAEPGSPDAQSIALLSSIVATDHNTTAIERAEH